MFIAWGNSSVILSIGGGSSTEWGEWFGVGSLEEATPGFITTTIPGGGGTGGFTIFHPPLIIPPPVPNATQSVIERENAQYNQCVNNGGQLAIVLGATESIGKDSSSDKAGINIVGAALDIQKSCLGFYPLALYSPNYLGLFGAGDLVE